MMKKRYCIIAFLSLIVVAGYAIQDSSILSPDQNNGLRSNAIEVGQEPEQASQELNGARARLAESYGKLPLHFEANNGQLDPQVKFLCRGIGYNFFLTRTEVVLALKKADSPSEISHSKDLRAVPNEEVHTQADPSVPENIFRMQFVDANSEPQIEGEDLLPGTVNHFIGNNPRNWHTDVSTHAKVRYKNIYPGIDLAFYGNQRQLEYDIIVSPDIDPGVIRLTFQGDGELSLDAGGNIVLHTAQGDIQQRSPLIYQEIGGERRQVSGGYVLEAQNRVGLRIGEYDRSLPLVIDPVIVYSTYLGGTGNDIGYGIAVDGLGNAYITGETSSSYFPVPNGYQTIIGGGRDVFVTKLNASGSDLVYSTYIGGSGDEAGYSIAVDSDGNTYVTGYTKSSNFPFESALQPDLGGTGTCDAFVFKLSASGSALVYSTYLGGTGNDIGYGIVVDGSGKTYVTGSTGSCDFPLAAPYQPHYGGGTTDGFVCKIDSTGLSLLYSTYLGGSSDDVPRMVAIDAVGNAYITGYTGSSGFPVINPLQQNLSGNYDAFVSKLNNSGSLVYSTYLGGAGYDEGGYIVVGSAGNAYVTGQTSSHDFPITINNSLQSAYGGGDYDAFVCKVNASGTALLYSTYLGGSDKDWGNGIALGESGSVYLTGGTWSSNFPLVASGQTVFQGKHNAYVCKLNATGTAFVYSTLLPVSSKDLGYAIAADSWRNAYVVGYTDSSNFPTVSPLYSTLAGSNDAIIAIINDATAVCSISGTVKLNGTGLPEVIVSLTGAATKSATTDENGNYKFIGLLNGSYALAASKTGYILSPQSIPVSLNGANVTGQNFVVVSAITVTSPNGGETWQRGTTHPITWTYTGVPGTSVKIEFFKGATLKGAVTAPVGSGGSGSWNWAIPATGLVGNDYKIKVSSVSNSSISDSSDNPFTLFTPAITVISPNGGETWQRGTTHPISWTYTGNVGTSVKIEFFKGATLKGSVTVPVGSGGSGSWNWAIPAIGLVGNDYKVKVRSVSNSSISDSSDNPFTLTTITYEYTVSQITYNFTGIESSSTNLNLGDDSTATYALPFSFSFYGSNYSSLTVSSNGRIIFSSTTSSGVSNHCLPSVDHPEPQIAPFWDDLKPSTSTGGGAVYVTTVGTAPNRKVIVEWKNVPHYGFQTGTVTFEAVLYEGSNTIEFHYSNVNFGYSTIDAGASATIGVQRDSSNATQFSCDTASLQDSFALRFSPPTPPVP